MYCGVTYKSCKKKHSPIFEANKKDICELPHLQYKKVQKVQKSAKKYKKSTHKNVQKTYKM